MGKMLVTRRIAFLLVVFGIVSQWRGARASMNEGNASSDEDEADEALEKMNFAEFKERYRRLIPYITYFVANNYANRESSEGARIQQGYERETVSSTSPLIRKPQRRPVPVVDPRDPSSQLNGGRGVGAGGGGRKLNGARGASSKHRVKFVPSVQYDPEDVNGNTDYFAPVAYETNFNFDPTNPASTNHYKNYERQQYKSSVNPEMSSSATRIYHRENNHYPKDELPSRLHDHPATTHGTEYLPYGTKNHVQDSQRDWIVDDDTDHNYPSGIYQPIRQNSVKTPASKHRPKPTRILAQYLPRQTILHQRLQPAYSTINDPAAGLNDIMKSFQLTNRLPETLNKNNIDSSIKTLVEILGILNNAKQHTSFTKFPVSNNRPIASFHAYPIASDKIPNRPRVVTEERFQATPSPQSITRELYGPEAATFQTNIRHAPLPLNYEIVNSSSDNGLDYYGSFTHDGDEDAPYVIEKPIKLEEQTEHGYEISEDHRDDTSLDPIITETPINNFPSTNDKGSIGPQLAPSATLVAGATRGKPNVDYPAHATIPETEFNCKEQRYKGFFGDPSTGCQVWHYCDLNGGKSSFLCPNGTIFNQVALTCDWWFNVKCESTTQLYVLNERLYKYILPVMPKFPEDFSGPEVDQYLELKFKEMEAKLKEKKRKKQQEKAKAERKMSATE